MGDAVRGLDTIPGSTIAARSVLAEIAKGMEEFPSAGHCASWLGCARVMRRVLENVLAVRRARGAHG
jgi:hypothetical protein